MCTLVLKVNSTHILFMYSQYSCRLLTGIVLRVFLSASAGKRHARLLSKEASSDSSSTGWMNPVVRIGLWDWVLK